MKKILRDTKAKIHNELPVEKKLFLYSAHDYNVGYFLKALDLFDRSRNPKYASYIVVELHKIKNVHYFKVSPLKPKKKQNYCSRSFADLVRKLQLQRAGGVEHSQLRRTVLCEQIRETDARLLTKRRLNVWNREQLQLQLN